MTSGTSFDRESTPKVEFRAECSLASSTVGPKGRETLTPEKRFVRGFQVVVNDVDDEGPRLWKMMSEDGVISVDLDRHPLSIVRMRE